MRYQLPQALLHESFGQLRACGAGCRECQILWVSPWADPQRLTAVAHPRHSASAVGFAVEEDWLNRFWLELADKGLGVRCQVHTHPGGAYHSATDDAYPLIRSTGFLSLVIPRFAQGPVGFADAYLTQVQPDGGWQEQVIKTMLEIV
jgi:proteasome lid subunit RPN8/RPN11